METSNTCEMSLGVSGKERTSANPRVVSLRYSGLVAHLLDPPVPNFGCNNGVQESLFEALRSTIGGVN